MEGMSRDKKQQRFNDSSLPLQCLEFREVRKNQDNRSRNRDRRKIRTVSDPEKQVKKFFKKEEMTGYVKCCSKFKKIKSENRFNNMDMIGD